MRQVDADAPKPVAGDGNGGSRLLDNLVAFGRALRAVGIPCTPTQIADLARAITWIDLGDRAEVFRTARALLVTRKEDLLLFETVFNRFWRPPTAVGGVADRTRPPRPSRERGRFTVATYAAFKARQDLEEREVADRAGTYSDEEVLKRKRFAEMSDGELEEVRRIIGRLGWQAALRVTRRRAPHPSGPEIDLRRVLRHTGRLGALPPRVPRRRRKEKPRPVVLLADISGSMERYSRLLLQLFHALVRTLPDGEAFVFGTRLSRVTPQLRLRNPDRALDEVAGEVVDWAGGTRIGACLGDFNRSWSRRVLRRGAVVVLVSDGCDRGRPERLAQQMARLRGRCHRLIWLNPHADHEEYAPRVAGMRAALPYVDDFLPIGDLRSLRDFADALGRLGRSGRRAPRGGGHRVAGRYATFEDER